MARDLPDKHSVADWYPMAWPALSDGGGHVPTVVCMGTIESELGVLNFLKFFPNTFFQVLGSECRTLRSFMGFWDPLPEKN